MVAYVKGAFGKLRTGLGGTIRLREQLFSQAPVLEPVVGGFYVAVNGSDAANGSVSTPFATLARAIDATRGGTEKRIFLRGGTHHLSAKIALNNSDKGTYITAYPGEVPVISGGEVLTGFVDEGDGLFSKSMPQPTGLDLSIGGVRQRVAQSGTYSPLSVRSGWLSAEAADPPSATEFRFRSGEIQSGVLQTGLMVQVFDASRRQDFISSVIGIDEATRVITLADPMFLGNILNGATFRLLNHPSFVGRDGEFAWRSFDSRLVVRPASASFEAQGVINPKLVGLIDLQSGADDVTLMGLTFSDTVYSGYAVSISASQRTKIGNCVFRNVGDGVRAINSAGGKVGGCTFNDLAGSGVVLNSGATGWKVYANRFSRLGTMRKDAAALYGQACDTATFAFNEVQQTPRYGVTVKGGNGANRVIYNTFRDTATETADSAAIEFTKGSPDDLGSIIEGNFIDRAPGYPPSITGEFSSEFNTVEFNVSSESPRYRGAGVYLNDLASGVTVRGNFVRSASMGHFVINGGDRNLVENNVSILDEFDEYYAQIINNTVLSGSDLVTDSNTFSRNVVYSIGSRTVNPWVLRGLGTGTAINENIYFNADDAPGFDSISVTSDPRFINRAADDFRFDLGSPALAMGLSQLAWDWMGLKGYTQTAAATYDLENFWGAVLSPGAVDPGTGFVLQTSKVENIDTVPSWEGQETQLGLMFVQGDVASGQVVVAVVDGKDVPCQLNHRITWPDGSLRTATAVWEMPAIAAGQIKEVVWTRRNGTWGSQDSPKHTSPAAFTSKLAVEYAFTSWKGRNVANTLTAERGPKYFRSAEMLASGNDPWIERTMTGPVMTEWRASAFARKGDNTTDPNFAAFLYVRAYGGTANNPKRLRFVYRTAHGWTDNSVPADEQGIRVDMDLKLGNTIIRGKSLGTAGWSARDGFKGGFYASCGADGTMDWVDAATGTLITPPKLVVRHDVAYNVRTNFFPPFDTTNPAYSPAASIDFAPQTRGTLSQQQDDVGDNGNIPWHVSTAFAKSMIAHARRTASEVAVQDRVARVTAWGLAALGSIGFDKTTRKLHCYLPPERNPDPVGLGNSIYNGTKPTATDGDLNPYIKGRDAAHFPQVTWWTALTEGDTHMRDLAMAEATLPGMFEASGAGFYMSLNNTFKIGGVSVNGQLRAVGQAYRPMIMASTLADMNDPNGKLVKALLDMQIDASRLIPPNEDVWRGSGTRQQTEGIYRFDAGNEPSYKLWMHMFSAMVTVYGWAILGDERLATEAHWWNRLVTVFGGGYVNDSDYLKKPDPFNVGAYFFIALSGPGPNSVIADRRAWNPGQWSVSLKLVDYSTDGQTVTFVEGNAPVNGMILTVTGIHNLGVEPPVVTEFRQPTGLSRQTPYYAVQTNGMSCKLATSPGGTPVTFSTGGAVIRGMIARAGVNGVTGTTAPGTVTGSGISSYFTQATVTLALYRWYLAKTDSRVQLARNTLKVYKDADTVQGGYDIRGKTTVPY